jgi:cytochrome c-type biogenesis protein
MIGELFGTLTKAVSASAPVALAGAFAWGIVSVLLSPCHLASIPLIVGFLGVQPGIGTGRAFRLSLLFAAGILVTIALLGVLTAAFGRMLGDIGPVGNWVVAAIFLVVGLHLLGIIPLPLAARGPSAGARRGYVGALILGLVFGLALGPCTFAFLAPVLGVTFRVGAGNPVLAVLLFAAYGVGHCAVIVAAGTAGARIQRVLDWGNHSRAAAWMRRGCGVLILLGGAWMVWTSF